MERSCDSCGNAYEAKLKTSRFCSATCRVRASRGADTKVTKPSTVTALPSPDAVLDALAESLADGAVSAALRAELVDAARLDTTLGQQALSLARRIDGGRETGSSVSSLSKELRAVRAEALKGAHDAASKLAGYRDELAARRKGA